MNAPAGTTLTQRTEWVLGLGEPKPPSRLGLTLFAFAAALGLGGLIWFALLGGVTQARTSR